jgi:hypothetical protein
VSRVHGAWTGRQCGLSRSGVSLAQGMSGTMGLQSSLAEAGEEEGDEAVLMRGSSRQSRLQRSGEEDRQRLELSVRAEEGERELGNEGNRCGDGLGWSSPFYNGRGAPGMRQRAVTGSIKALMQLMVDRGYKGGGSNRGIKAGV